VSDELPGTREEDLLDHYRMLVDLWSPRLRIGERVSVRIVPAIESADEVDAETECTMFPAEVVPESAGLWDFQLAVSSTHPPAEPERAVVHELVHLLLEPIRRRVFYGMPLYGARSPRQTATVEAWETVVQRVADAFLRYEERVKDALLRPSEYVDEVLMAAQVDELHALIVESEGRRAIKAVTLSP